MGDQLELVQPPDPSTAAWVHPWADVGARAEAGHSREQIIFSVATALAWIPICGCTLASYQMPSGHVRVQTSVSPKVFHGCWLLIEAHSSSSTQVTLGLLRSYTALFQNPVPTPIPKASHPTESRPPCSPQEAECGEGGGGCCRPCRVCGPLHSAPGASTLAISVYMGAD